jgi:integrase
MTTESALKKRTTKWTDEKIKALRPPEGKREKRFMISQGLYIHARQHADGSIAKHWQYRAQLHGVRRWLSLGEYPAVGLAKVREELLTHERAHEAAKKGEGDHPVLAARHARAIAKALPTVADLFTEWLADKRLGSPRKGGMPVRERTLALLTENFNADIRDRVGDHKIAKVTRAALQSCIDAPRKRGSPGAAAQVYRTLRGLVHFAIKRGYIEGADPMRGVENPRPYRPAEVVAASDAEIKALLAELDKSSLSPATKLAIEFQLLTGARPGEVRLAEWHEVSLQDKRWTLPAERVKTNRRFVIHLSQQAIAVLRAANALRGSAVHQSDRRDKKEFVFPGTTGGPLEKMAINHALARHADAIVAGGGKKLRPNDLRRTFRTMLSRIGVAPHIAELCENRGKPGMMRVYDGHDYAAEMRDAWNRAGSHVHALRTGGAIVIPITKRA